jgi:hypothetical protein
LVTWPCPQRPPATPCDEQGPSAARRAASLPTRPGLEVGVPALDSEQRVEDLHWSWLVAGFSQEGAHSIDLVSPSDEHLLEQGRIFEAEFLQHQYQLVKPKRLQAVRAAEVTVKEDAEMECVCGASRTRCSLSTS